jgi:hypothetical protein
MAPPCLQILGADATTSLKRCLPFPLISSLSLNPEGLPAFSVRRPRLGLFSFPWNRTWNRYFDFAVAKLVTLDHGFLDVPFAGFSSPVLLV